MNTMIQNLVHTFSIYKRHFLKVCIFGWILFCLYCDVDILYDQSTTIRLCYQVFNMKCSITNH